MYSFYGGRPGNSFIIITTYRSIADMVAKFKQGPNYTAVHYDEHVMINTVNKNDPDNGKVYRRGYDFTNTMGGAEYIGTIVGPAGKAPMLEMTTVADVKSKHASEGYDERFTSGQYSLTNENLVPGKTGSGTFNDAITWACCSIRNENDEDATAYIGFTFPYTVIDYETSWIEPYVAGKYTDTSSATRVDDETHPFFEKWHINVPKGVKGNAFMNLKVEAASTNVEEYTGQADDINHGRAILAYDYYNYDDYQNGSPVRLYLGDYNMIDNVSIDDEGTITIDYSHDDDSVWTKKIKWVKSVTLNTETGLFTVVYNHTTDASGNLTTYTTYLDWINEVNIADDGTVTFGHTQKDDTVFDKKIKWVTGVTINNNGTVTFKWNNGTTDTVFNNIIQWISSVNLAADGTLTVGYNNGAADSVFSKAVKWIRDVQVADDGTVIVRYNNNDPAYVASQKLKWINDITLADNGTLIVRYNNNSANTVFANKIRWLTGATLANNGTFTLSWNNGTANTVYTNLFKWISGASVDQTGTITFNWNNGDESTVLNNVVRWISGTSLAADGTFTISWNNGTEDTVYHLNWLTGVSVNTNLEGQDEGTGNQKLHVTWANGTTEDIGNPINYIMSMVVNTNNHLLVRYSDPAKRVGGLTYNNINGWTDLGQIIQPTAEYGNGSVVTGLNWAGIGQLIDNGTNNKIIKFNISPTALINTDVNTVTITSGTLDGTNGTDTVTALDLTTATAVKTLTGLQFKIDSGIASSGTAGTSFINLAITDMGLLFGAMPHYVVDDKDVNFDKTSGLLTISTDSAHTNADKNYDLIVKPLYEEPQTKE